MKKRLLCLLPAILLVSCGDEGPNYIKYNLTYEEAGSVYLDIRDPNVTSGELTFYFYFYHTTVDEQLVYKNIITIYNNTNTSLDFIFKSTYFHDKVDNKKYTSTYYAEDDTIHYRPNSVTVNKQETVDVIAYIPDHGHGDSDISYFHTIVNDLYEFTITQINF